jgi:hypothetical protein
MFVFSGVIIWVPALTGTHPMLTSMIAMSNEIPHIPNFFFIFFLRFLLVHRGMIPNLHYHRR